MDSFKRKRIAIIGGGITGMAAAHKILELSRDNISPEIVLIESKPRLGGIIETKNYDDCILELGPDAFITQKPWALDLCKRIGFADKLINTNTQKRKTMIVKNGKLTAMPEGFYLLAPAKIRPLFESTLLSREGKMRMAIEYFLPVKETVQEESLAQFVRRRFGTEALDTIAQPMVGGIYGGDPEKLSLQAIMPRFIEMEKEHGSIIKALMSQKSTGDTGARYSMFVTPEAGLQSFIEELEKRLNDIEILKETTVNIIENVEGKNYFRVDTSKKSIEAEAVIIAAPANAAARLLTGIDQKLSDLTGSIEFSSSAILNLLFKSDDIPDNLEGFGFVVPFKERFTMMACTFTSIKFPNRTPERYIAIRAFLGGLLQQDLLKEDDQTLKSKILEELDKLLNINATPVFSYMSRYPNSMPQYNLGHIDLVDKIEKRQLQLPGLALCGNSYRGVGIPDSIKSGEEAAQRIFEQLYSTETFKQNKIRK